MDRSIPKIVVIGGGSAPAILAQGLKGATDELTAIVSTTDTGSSTGVIRKLFPVPGPGDIRQAISSMSSPPDHIHFLKDLFEYRLKPQGSPELKGMPLGNLILAAAAQMWGDFEKAVLNISSILWVKGRVIPVTSEPAHLQALLEDGTTLIGEAMVRGLGKPRITDLELIPRVRTSKWCEKALQGADLIVIGPGCLYTSIIACLLVEGVTDAIKGSEAKTCLISNHTTTPGQTDSYRIIDHIEEILKYLGKGSIDHVLITTRRPPDSMIDSYKAEGVHFLEITEEELKEIRGLDISPVLGDFIEKDWEGKRRLHKVDTIRHEPEAVVKALLSLI